MAFSIKKNNVSSSRNAACIGGIGVSVSDSALSVFECSYDVIAVRLF